MGILFEQLITFYTHYIGTKFDQSNLRRTFERPDAGAVLQYGYSGRSKELGCAWRRFLHTKHGVFSVTSWHNFNIFHSSGSNQRLRLKSYLIFLPIGNIGYCK